MGIFRGGIVLTLGIILFFSLIFLNSFFILQSSLKYENVKTGLYPILQNLSASKTQQLIPDEIVGDFNLTDAAQDFYNRVKGYCQNKKDASYNFTYQGYEVSFPCENANSTSSESLINETYNDVIYDIYYKQYNCNFWNCFSTTQLPFFLVSQKARDYWNGKFYFTLILSLILIALMFLFMEQKRDLPIVVGILIILASFPLLKLGDILYALAGSLSIFINLFLSSIHSVFAFSLVLGIVLLGSGIALRFWNPGAIKEKISKNQIVDIVKKEIASESQTKKKKK